MHSSGAWPRERGTKGRWGRGLNLSQQQEILWVDQVPWEIWAMASWAGGWAIDSRYPEEREERGGWPLLCPDLEKQ
jgi:hypothetical protein